MYVKEVLFVCLSQILYLQIKKVSLYKLKLNLFTLKLQKGAPSIISKSLGRDIDAIRWCNERVTSKNYSPRYRQRRRRQSVKKATSIGRRSIFHSAFVLQARDTYLRIRIGEYGFEYLRRTKGCLRQRVCVPYRAR